MLQKTAMFVILNTSAMEFLLCFVDNKQISFLNFIFLNESL